MKKSTKWKLYEKRWKIRNIYFNKALRRHFLLKYFHVEPVMPIFAHKKVMSKKKTNDYIAELIRSGEPFFVGRFGNTELSIVTSVLRNRIVGRTPENDERLEEWFTRSKDGAGIFPCDLSIAGPFSDVILDAAKELDLLAMWHLHMEDFVIEEYMKQAKLTYLLRLEPWLAENPWSAALEGKKVLIIHPFEDTIIAQYKKRELLFPGKNVLPEFELHTLKAVQTMAGLEDPRFKDWFEALEYMYEEALKIDFDIAIIGCGAYGMPLGAKLKKAGKQTIHLGGATQLLFGIKGRRWEENYPSKIAECFNGEWTYPAESEKPANAAIIENACYWK